MGRIGRVIPWLACLAASGLACGALLLPSPAGATTGCLLTFRHGGIVQADRCQAMGDALAYLRFGGWVVVQKAALMSIQDETGVTQLFPRWPPAEERTQLEAVPKQGGVPIGPSALPPLPPLPPPTPAGYAPVPVPTPAPPAYQVDGVPLAYAGPGVFCPSCVRRSLFRPGLTPTHRVRTSHPGIGPMAGHTRSRRSARR